MHLRRASGVAGEAIEAVRSSVESGTGVAAGPVIALVHVNRLDRLYASAGHQRVTELTRTLGRCLEGVQRNGDAVIPLGDRRYAVVLHGLRNRGHALLAANGMRRCAEEISWEGGDRLDVSIGVSSVPSTAADADTLLRQAEVALLNGRHHNEKISFFRTETASRIASQWDVEERLAAAIAGGDLTLHFQPKVALPDCRVVGAEALCRWFDPVRGAVDTAEFIGVAESAGLITDLTHFVIQRACHQLDGWPGDMRSLNVAVNVSPELIQDRGLVDVLRSACGIWGIEPASLTLEVTEDALIARPDESHAILTEVRDLGFRVSIDDFGTGYSSLSYLKEIPADELKLDRSFVMGMHDDPKDREIVRHAISLAHGFGLSVVAEGVESEAILSELCEFGCDYAQGYHLSPPLPAADFVQWFEDHAVQVATG